MARFYDEPYFSDSLNGNIQIRLSEAEADAYGAPTDGTLISNMHAYNGGSKRKFGVHARGYVLKRVEEVTGGTPPVSLSKSFFKFLPVGTLTAWAAAQAGTDVTVGGKTWNLDSKVAETAK